MSGQNHIGKLKKMRKDSWSGIWAQRILSELEYLTEVSKAEDGAYDEMLKQAIERVWNYVNEHGAITRELTEQVEKELEPMQDAAKQYRVLLIGHAHIDMNWMWGFQETASVTVDTFETMLQLMDEYPQYTFAQSQASVYAIIEEYYPELLVRIKKRIKEGRWEVSASTWVENDKNMSGSEAMARHILYTKNYLSELLDVDIDSLTLDFEPDTFGHNENMPEILNQGGVKYYYHCRGYDKEHVYRWKAPSGAEVIVYREPVWYNATVLYDSLTYVPSFCKEYGLKTALKMYGVGDHGGGPTRRDIERWMEMQTWPLMPEIKFGTFAEFYGELEKVREQLPVVSQELNYIFSGCYTSQSRIKKANKHGEDRLFESEMMDVLAHQKVEGYQTPSSYETAWRKILFNQFHDILPGSGMVETREYGMGEFQKALAVSQINMTHAMRAICNAMDTSDLAQEEPYDWSFGAGVGYGTHEKEGHMGGYVGRAGGKRRIINIFNASQYPRKEVVKLTLWDWNGNSSQLCAYNAQNQEVRCQILGRGTHYWGHTYYTIALEAEVGAFGYATYILDERAEKDLGVVWRNQSTSVDEGPDMLDPRVDRYVDSPIIMENELVRAEFSPNTMKMLSLIDKKRGKEMLSAPSAYFREITENTQYKMTSWRVGNYASICDLNESAPVRLEKSEKGALVQKLGYFIKQEHYMIHAEISLEAGSEVFDYQLTIDWHEIGNEEKGVPQLNFIVPLGYTAETYACAVPFGVKERVALAQDVPCIGYMSGIPAEGEKRGVVVMSDCKYGFRGCNNSIAVTLIRSSFDPDEMPEQGKHFIRLGVGVCDTDAGALTEKYERYVHPIYACSNSAHEGKLPNEQSFMKIDGKVRVSAVKLTEDKKDVIIRIHSLCNEAQLVIIEVEKKVQEAYFADILEKKKDIADVCDGKVKVQLPAGAVRTIRLVLQ